jgi:hypothetical protein
MEPWLRSGKCAREDPETRGIMRTRHDDCMLRTAELEIDLFGGVESASVKAHVEMWLAAFADRWTEAYGTRPREWAVVEPHPDPDFEDPGIPERRPRP